MSTRNIVPFPSPAQKPLPMNAAHLRPVLCFPPPSLPERASWWTRFTSYLREVRRTTRWP